MECGINHIKVIDNTHSTYFSCIDNTLWWMALSMGELYINIPLADRQQCCLIYWMFILPKLNQLYPYHTYLYFNEWNNQADHVMFVSITVETFLTHSSLGTPALYFTTILTIAFYNACLPAWQHVSSGNRRIEIDWTPKFRIDVESIIFHWPLLLGKARVLSASVDFISEDALDVSVPTCFVLPLSWRHILFPGLCKHVVHFSRYKNSLIPMTAWSNMSTHKAYVPALFGAVVNCMHPSVIVRPCHYY